jgi:hypothetical protein
MRPQYEFNADEQHQITYTARSLASIMTKCLPIVVLNPNQPTVLSLLWCYHTLCKTQKIR